jgi:ribose transport system permease protein
MPESNLAIPRKSFGTKMLKGSRDYFKNYVGLLIGMAVLVTIISVNTPVFLSPKNLLNVVRQISNNMFLASATTLMLIHGGIDLSMGAIVSLSSVLCVSAITTMGIPIPLAIVVTILDGAIVHRTNLPPFIVTYCTLSVCQGAAYLWTGAQPVRITNQNFVFLGTGFLGPIPLPVIYMIAIFSLVWFILNRTKLGRHIYATGGNSVAAALSGVDIRKIRYFVYGFSGLMAAFAGIVLSARMYSGQPTAGGDSFFEAIAAVVLGGTSMMGGAGRVGGTLIGALILGVLSNGLNLAGIDSYWQLVAKGFIVLGAVYVDSIKQSRALKGK